MDYLIEPEKKVPVAAEVDIAVAGGGISGMIASIAAARQGARVLVVDRFGTVGGNMGPGMFAGGTLHLAIKSSAGPENDDALVNRMGMGGLPEEFCRRVIYARPDSDSLSECQRQEIERRHCNVPGLRMGSDYIIDSQVVPYVASQMMREAGVETMLSTWVAAPAMDGTRVRGLFVETKSGRQAVRAKLVVDATGDADVALRAGAPIIDFRSDPGIGVFYALGDVDWPQYQLYAAEHREPAPDDIAWLHRTMLAELGDENGDPTMPAFHHLLPFIRSAWETGEFKFIRDLGIDARIITRPWKAKRHGLVNSRAESSGKLSPGDARQVSLLERELRDYAFELSRFLRRHVPGFEQCYLHTIAPYMGARGGRSIESERMVTHEDMSSAGTRFDDVIYIYYDDKCAEYGCDVPYRVLVPREIDGLLAVGRSAIRRSPNLRQRWSVMLMAQAGGIAAAMCAAQGAEPRHLNVKALQKVLVELGCPLGDRDRLIELGLA